MKKYEDLAAILVIIIFSIILALTSVFIGALWGMLTEVKNQQERAESCLEKTSVIPVSEACSYFGQDTKCTLKPRLSYTYRSHKYIACMHGKTTAAWGQ